MTQGFTGFTEAHFDAYLEKKWRSNRFNLERMRVREQAEALGRQVLAAIGDDGEGLELSATTDHPTIFNNKQVESQWVMLGRSPGTVGDLTPLIQRERLANNAPEDHSPVHTQALIGLCVNAEGLKVVFRCHRHAHLDRSNFVRRVSVDEEVTALLAVLSALPTTMSVSVGETSSCAVGDLTETQLNAMLDDYRAEGQCWTIGQHFGREDNQLATPELSGVVTELVQALMPLYRYVAWCPDNDRVDGASFLADSAQAQPVNPTEEKTTEEIPTEVKPAAPNVSDSAKSAGPPTTKGGAWNYRPTWEFKGTGDKGSAKPSTPSARVRQRAQDVASSDSEWNYRGPSAKDTPKAAQSESKPERSDRPDSPRGNNRGGGRGGRRPERSSGDRKSSHRQPRGSGNNRRTGPSGKDRFDRRQQKRDRGPRNFGPSKSKKNTTWVVAEGDVQVLDHVKVTGGLLNGKVGKVVDITKKGNLKVDIGDMVFEVVAENAEKVRAE